MKKLLSLLFVMLLLSVLLCGCDGANDPTGNAEGQLSIVTTIFPEYDWLMQILGNQAEEAQVTMLLDSGVDLHSYQPTADDIIKIANCDLFVYVGGESDKWVEDALKGATNEDRVVINLLDVLGDAVKEEELVEGMEAEEEEEEGEEEGPEYDEHVWLSLQNAMTLVEALHQALVTIDPAHEDIYDANTEDYLAQLESLDMEYLTAVEAADVKTLLFGDRFPFRYLADDYGLDYYAAFVGCSAESEASFETIAFLADKVSELGLSTVLTLEGTDHKLAETIVSTTEAKDVQILSMDSMQSTTAEDVKAGASYLGLMEKNLSVLKEALELE